MGYNFDFELQGVIDMLPTISFEDPVSARTNPEMLALLGEEIDESGVDVENRTIAGTPDIPIRIYKPTGLSTTTAGLLYFHSGGFVVGDLDSEHESVVGLCRELGIVIVSVDYRKAPEDPYPASLEDCYRSLCWFHQNAESLRVDSNRIGSRGDSAGGGLTAALTLLTRDRGGPRICFQFLGIPELDDRLTTVSMTEFTDTPLWNRPNAILSWKYYLGDNYTPGGKDVPYTAAPARADIDDLRGLPPAFVKTMEFDPLRDEGIEYALKLLQAGVSVELHNYPGTFHGSEFVGHAAVSQRSAAESLQAMRRGLHLDE